MRHQVTVVFKDLLADLRAKHGGRLTAHNLIGMLADVKKFSSLGQDLREILFNEALNFVERAGTAIADQKREIATLSTMVQVTLLLPPFG